MRDELSALVPVTHRAPDWGDVLARAEPTFWRRRLVLAIAAALAALVAAGAVAAALGGFDGWLRGNPGKPAPRAEQQRFEAANGRTWAAFPTSTKLRELIDTTVDGKRYVLFGFKSGQTLCLTLKAVSLGHSTRPRCAPLSLVSRTSAPLVIVDGDDGFTDRYNHPSAQFSFGIVADGVSQVVVRALDGAHHARVQSNAYLWVENEPNTGNRVLTLSTVSRHTRTTLAATGFLSAVAVSRPVRGPTRVQRRIAHPHIGWYDRGEHRGHLVAGTDFIKPDPLSNIVVGLDGQYCLTTSFGSTTLGGRGCSPGESFFLPRGFNAGLYSEGGAFTALSGAAADGVAGIKVFLSDGQTIRPAMKDNLFSSLLPWSGMPARVVAYDRKGHVVGFQVLSGVSLAPRAAGTGLIPRIRITAPNGSAGVARIGRIVATVRCWRFNSAPLSCVGLETGGWVEPAFALPVGRDVFVVGSYRDPVMRVELRFPNGDVTRAKAVDNVFVVAIPKAHLGTTRRDAMLVGLDDRNSVVQRTGVVYRANR